MRNFLNLCFLILVCSFAKGQTIDELDKELGVLFQKRDFKKAITVAQKLIELTQKEVGENHPDYASSLSNLGVAYAGDFQFDLAEALYIRASAIRKNTLGENHPGYAGGLNNLGTLYFRAGKYEKAKSLLLEAIAIRKKALGEEHPDCILSMHNLADLYNLMSEYEKAEPLYIRVIALRKKVLGEDHPYTAISVNNLANLYMSLGQYEKTEQLYIQAKEIQKRKVGEEHADYTTGLNNLAELYRLMGKYGLSETIHLQALEIRRKTVGENHTNFAQSLSNLSSLYAELGDFAKAERLLLQTMEIQGKIFGEMHPIHAGNLNNLANLYVKMGKIDKAEELFVQSLDLRKKLLGENHSDYIKSLYDLTALYTSSGQYEKAEPVLIEATSGTIQNLRKNFAVLSEKEKGNFLANKITLIDAGNSFLFNVQKKPASVLASNFNMLLFFKSLSLADTRNMLQAVRYSKDTSVQKTFNSWQTCKNLLARQYSLPVSSRLIKMDSLEARAEELEKELSRESGEFRKQQLAMQVCIKEISEHLQADEAAIEFVQFRLQNTKMTDSVMYAAYIIRNRDSIPMFIPLFEEKQLQQVLSKAGRTPTLIARNIYTGPQGKTKKNVIAGDLYNLIWRPLEPFLKGVNTISYSPSGKLFDIAFHALPAGNDTLLMDKYKLDQYTSTRLLAIKDNKNQSVAATGVVLFGDANFSMDSLELAGQRIRQDEAVEASYVYMPQTRGSGIASWPDLPGTADEIKKIKLLFELNKQTASMYTQTDASEKNFKALSGNSPKVLHLATHGFFLPEPDKKGRGNGLGQRNVYTVADDPLLRSGLVLAGGNYAWSGKMPIEGLEDGIATAYEISQLNLSNTELVVLSACETALGDVKGSEGVFGLQRAFKMAGVKKLIVSLWKVPDRETAELMTAFYFYWLKGKTAKAAFAQAHADMRKKYPHFIGRLLC